MPAVTSCPDPRVFQQLKQMTAAEVEGLERHLEQCPACQAKFRRYTAEHPPSGSGVGPGTPAGRLLTRFQTAVPTAGGGGLEATAFDLAPVDPSGVGHQTVCDAPKSGATGVPPGLEATADSLPALQIPPEATAVSPPPLPSRKPATPAKVVDKTAVLEPDKATGPAAFEFLDPPQAADEIGRLGRYAIHKVLGKGGMGMVFKALDPMLQRLVALKVMLPEIAKDQSARQRFLREARATAAIKNDHIITIYEVSSEDSVVPYLAMEFLEGSPLDVWLTEGNKPTVPQILRIGKEMARGLGAAHDKGLIHRDIKPGNIWLEAPDGRVKILDFGLARAVNEDLHLTQTGLIVGTPAYMAPEQAAGEAVDHRCDLFSLGCVLYRLCSGELPFSGATTMALLMALALEHPKPLRDVNPGIPAPLADLVAKLLAKKPDQRPQKAQAVVEAIEAIERGLPLTAATATAMPVRVQPGAGPAAADTARERYQASGVMRSGVAPRSSSGIRPYAGHHRSSRRRSSAMGKGTVALAVLLLAAGGGIGYYLFQTIKMSKGVLEITAENPKVEVILEQNGDPVRILYPEAEKRVQLDVGNYHVRLGKYGEGWVPDPENISIAHDTKAVLTVRRGVAAIGGLKPMEPFWLKDVAASSVLDQIQKVGEKMRDRNPGFTPGDLGAHRDDNGDVDSLQFDTDKVTDLMPLRGFPKLRELFLKGPGPLSDLSPLQGMQLEVLDIGGNKVENLTPLKGMPLTTLILLNNPVRDLSPLKDCRKLHNLNLNEPMVAGLAELKDVPLESLFIYGKIDPNRDGPVLRGIKTLKKINSKPVEDFLQ